MDNLCSTHIDDVHKTVSENPNNTSYLLEFFNAKGYENTQKVKSMIKFVSRYPLDINIKNYAKDGTVEKGTLNVQILNVFRILWSVMVVMIV